MTLIILPRIESLHQTRGDSLTECGLVVQLLVQVEQRPVASGRVVYGSR
jgi:hypothetical protein